MRLSSWKRNELWLQHRWLKNKNKKLLSFEVVSRAYHLCKALYSNIEVCFWLSNGTWAGWCHRAVQKSWNKVDGSINACNLINGDGFIRIWIIATRWPIQCQPMSEKSVLKWSRDFEFSFVNKFNSMKFKWVHKCLSMSSVSWLNVIESAAREQLAAGPVLSTIKIESITRSGNVILPSTTMDH